MKRKIRVSAPGKLIFLGEHAAVYGKPVLIATVAKRCFVTLTSRDDKKIEIFSEYKNFACHPERAKRVEGSLANARISQRGHESPLYYPAFIISQTLEFYKKNAPSGFTLSINSEIPIGGGMGSSAALAVSIAGAISLFLGEKFDKEKINNIAYLCEQKKHGNPSGADNSACCYGGLLWFRKETSDMKIIKRFPFNISEEIAKNLFTIFTGTPKESTKEMVSLVSELHKNRPEFTRSIFDHQETLVRELLPALKNGDKKTIKKCILLGEKNLEQLGVVSSSVKSLIRKIEEKEGAVKICGAGGKTKGAGILLAYHQDKKVLENLARVEKFEFSNVKLGTEGVRIEL